MSGTCRRILLEHISTLSDHGLVLSCVVSPPSLCSTNMTQHYSHILTKKKNIVTCLGKHKEISIYSMEDMDGSKTGSHLIVQKLLPRDWRHPQ